MIQDILGTRKPVGFTGGDAGDSIRWSNCEYASSMLEWEAKTTLREGLEKTLEWYQVRKVMA
jgi:nucleoside-diphosphate-sugar epimerase